MKSYWIPTYVDNNTQEYCGILKTVTILDPRQEENWNNYSRITEEYSSNQEYCEFDPENSNASKQ